MDKLILGVDAGNHKAKVAGVFGVDAFRTNICDWFVRDIEETFGPDDMEFEINERKGYAGTIALYENEFGSGATYGETKAHEDTKIRILLAIHRYIEKYCPGTYTVCLVTGQPIKAHKPGEKSKIIDMLLGKHEFTVNNMKVKLYIEDVRVAPEGSAAFWSNPTVGLVRIIDVGSGTVNMATIEDKHHIHQGSGTMTVGMETVRNKTDHDAIARAIYQQATKLKWHNHDLVQLCGGAANKLLPHFQKHFPNIDLLQPRLKRQFDLIALDPIYANAVGFYTLSRGAFQ